MVQFHSFAVVIVIVFYASSLDVSFAYTFPSYFYGPPQTKAKPNYSPIYNIPSSNNPSATSTNISQTEVVASQAPKELQSASPLPMLSASSSQSGTSSVTPSPTISEVPSVSQSPSASTSTSSIPSTSASPAPSNSASSSASEPATPTSSSPPAAPSASTSPSSSSSEIASTTPSVTSTASVSSIPSMSASNTAAPSPAPSTSPIPTSSPSTVPSSSATSSSIPSASASTSQLPSATPSSSEIPVVHVRGLLPCTQPQFTVMKSNLRTAILRREDKQRWPARLLFLGFHDCLPQSCDASIVFEQNRPPNTKIGVTLSLLNEARDGTCVGLADAIKIGLELSMELSHGPNVTCPKGNVPDAKIANPGGRLPSPGERMSSLIGKFTARGGINREEAVSANFGGHALGGFGVNPDNGMPGINFTDNPGTFNNEYCKKLMGSSGFATLPSDDTLAGATDDNGVKVIKKFVDDEDFFFSSFKSFLEKLCSL